MLLRLVSMRARRCSLEAAEVFSWAEFLTEEPAKRSWSNCAPEKQAGGGRL